MPLAVLAGILPKGALRYLRQKRQRPSRHWTDVWREEHAVAFTVAQMTQDAMLGEVHEALAVALRKGETLETFRARLAPLLEKRGWAPRGRGGDIPTRLKRIYNTNLRTARAAGQWDRISKSADLLPYLVYELGPSERHREEHAAWSGLCLKVGDPWWNTHYPPNGWGCKCRVRQVAKPPKGSTTKAPKVETRDWTNPASGEVRQVAKGIDPGWDYHVGAQRTQGVNLGWLRRVEAAAEGRGPAAAARMVERHVKGPGFRWFVRRPRTAEVPRREARPGLVEATPVAVLPEAAVADLGVSSAVVRLTEPVMHAQAVGRAGVPARLYARLQEVLEAKPRRQAGDAPRWTFTRTLDVGGERRRVRVVLELRDGAPEVVSLEARLAAAKKSPAALALDAIDALVAADYGPAELRKARALVQPHRNDALVDRIVGRAAGAGLRQKAIREGALAYAQTVSPKWRQSALQFVEATDDQMPGALPILPQASRVWLHSDSKTSTVTHELGHTLEFVNPELRDKVIAFLGEHTEGVSRGDLGPRTGRFGIRKGGAFDAVSPDPDMEFYAGYARTFFEWDDAPIGTVPIHGVSVYATEMVSVGVERMARDPLLFRREYPEYFAFILREVVRPD